MNPVYIIVFKSNNSIACNQFFSSTKEAMDYKKQQIANGECLNSIDKYDVVVLSPKIAETSSN